MRTFSVSASDTNSSYKIGHSSEPGARSYQPCGVGLRFCRKGSSGGLPAVCNSLGWSWWLGSYATCKKIIETPRLRNTKSGGRAMIFLHVALFPQAGATCSSAVGCPSLRAAAVNRDAVAFSQIEAVFRASRWKEIRGAGLVLHKKRTRGKSFFPA